MLPSRVENALLLGRALAARVETSEPGWTAWLFVCGVISRESTWDALRERWTLTREGTPDFVPPPTFMIRYTRFSEAHLRAEAQDDLDVAMRADPPDDWVVLAPNTGALERVLRHMLPDLDALHPPAAVDYPEPLPRFARNRTLEDVLGAG